jgi:hypothetical protein
VRLRRSIALSVAALGLGLAATIPACGGDEERVALAIEGTRWIDETTLELATECAELEGGVWVRSRGEEPPEVTVWGSPRVGTCAATAEIRLVPGVTKIVDAATSQVVDLPPRPDSS